MQRYRAASLAVALTIAFAGSAFAQAMPTNNPPAQANVRESEQYSAALRSNPAFRKKREAIECGPIADQQLHANCIASFEAYASPAKGGR
ncbi:MAG TPA: hypothetical protein VMS01_13870 [Stellaceae bacterium]|nr:hypothetical protein [Stellaceae bacterium]